MYSCLLKPMSLQIKECSLERAVEQQRSLQESLQPAAAQTQGELVINNWNKTCVACTMCFSFCWNIKYLQDHLNKLKHSGKVHLFQ